MQTVNVVGSTYYKENEIYLIVSIGRDERGSLRAAMVNADRHSESRGEMVGFEPTIIKDMFSISSDEFSKLCDGHPEHYIPTTDTIMSMLEATVHNNPGVRITDDNRERSMCISQMQLNGVRCVCNASRRCPCADVAKVASGAKDECSCGLFVAE